MILYLLNFSGAYMRVRWV